eukprot:scaffold211800_cov41-Tisochrysis_lutea.AAC.2
MGSAGSAQWPGRRCCQTRWCPALPSAPSQPPVLRRANGGPVLQTRHKQGVRRPLRDQPDRTLSTLRILPRWKTRRHPVLQMRWRRYNSSYQIRPLRPLQQVCSHVKIGCRRTVPVGLAAVETADPPAHKHPRMMRHSTRTA